MFPAQVFLLFLSFGLFITFLFLRYQRDCRQKKQISSHSCVSNESIPFTVETEDIPPEKDEPPVPLNPNIPMMLVEETRPCPLTSRITPVSM